MLRRILQILNETCYVAGTFPPFVANVPLTGSSQATDASAHTPASPVISSFHAPSQALRQEIWTGKTITMNRTRMKVMLPKLRIPWQHRCWDPRPIPDFNSED